MTSRVFSTTPGHILAIAPHWQHTEAFFLSFLLEEIAKNRGAWLLKTQKYFDLGTKISTS
jgi:hypothetical protein